MPSFLPSLPPMAYKKRAYSPTVKEFLLIANFPLIARAKFGEKPCAISGRFFQNAFHQSIR